MCPILQNHHVLAVHDIRLESDFYVRVLGFEIVNQPPGWIFVAKDSCLIMLGECPDDLPARETGCHSYFAYFRVANADDYYRHVKERRGEILSEIENKPWGMREFSVRSPGGHRLTIGQLLET